MRNIMRLLVAALIVSMLCACGAGEQKNTSSPEESTAVAQQVQVRFSDLDTGTTYSVTLQSDGSAIMGRSTESDIVITDEHVSRTHCKLTFSEGKLLVEDMDSTNGTFLMREGVLVEVLEAAELMVGDTLVLADVYLTLESIQ